MTPKVSIGLPVYNGENFIRPAIDCLLGQTFGDFELIISDNASTDSTEAICRQYEIRDPRVRYIRNAANVGLVRNFNQAFELSRAPYFKWAAHDDVYAPTYLQRCVDVLDRDPSVVLVYSKASIINDVGEIVGERVYPALVDDEDPATRFKRVLWVDLGSPPIFGLVRSEILRKTPLMGCSYAGDQIILAELALRGRFHQIGEFLHLHREHRHRSVNDHPSRHKLTRFVDPTCAGSAVFPTWRFLRDYIRVLHRVPISWGTRAACYFQLLRWTHDQRRHLFRDLTCAISEKRAVSRPAGDMTRNMLA